LHFLTQVRQSNRNVYFVETACFCGVAKNSKAT